MKDINAEVAIKSLEDIYFAKAIGEQAAKDFIEHIAEHFPILYGFFYGFINDENNFMVEKLALEERIAIIAYFSYAMKCLEDSNK